MKGETVVKNGKIHCQFDPEVLKQIKETAKQEKRTPSKQIEYMCEKFYEEKLK